MIYGTKKAEENRAQFAYVTAKLVADGGDEFEGGFSYLLTDTYDQTSAPGRLTEVVCENVIKQE